MITGSRVVYTEILRDTGYKVIASAVIGAITALFAYLLTTLSSKLFSLWSGSRSEAIFALPSATWLLWSLGALVTGGLVVSGLLKLIDGKVTGPPDTLHSLADPDFRINPKNGIVSTIIATMSTGFGASMGLYGPLIHFGSVVADMVRKLARNDSISYSTFVACGVAGAISAAFLTPIGAALFATEFIIRRMSLKEFLPISIASTSAYLVALTLQREPTFSLAEAAFDLNITNLGLTILLGLIIGAVTIAFTRSIETFNAGAQKYIPYKQFSPLWAALVLFGIGAFFPDVLGTGVPFIQRAFTEAHPTLFLALLLVAKFFATGVCVAGRFYGGLFAPALFIGAITGALLANLLGAVGFGFTENLAGELAIFPVIAAFAVASAMVGAPFAAAIIVLEMTQSYEVASLSFSTCVIATYVYSTFMGRSFFDRRLKDRGVDYEDNAPVRQVKTTEISSLAAPLDTINTQLARYKLDEENVLAIRADTSIFATIREMDHHRLGIVEIVPATEGGSESRLKQYVSRDRILEYAWNLTVADSQSATLSTLQNRDFTPLTESDLAHDLDEREVLLIRNLAQTQFYHAGETIIKTGTSSRTFYVMSTGIAKVNRELRDQDDAVLIAYLYPGNIFGEIAFLTGEPRTADVVAETDCIVQEFSIEALAEHQDDAPLIYASLNKMASKRKIKLARQDLKISK